ncbi:unnamed protein product [Kuraishia capsulata CBS 1993]|uniref:Pyruvate decarboxylase n=1 Tax=Kuraishia capsulata CBS 1993 TaxID=1382522 RepID=W6ML38_9ASCO|nr:uncharacterized protein KUCA_T00003166001 [Kuraishia capsulata CBS 1993]CDK27189.1 unnamed protein product [Kuraishia capsulata CBS 1993]
MTPALLDPEVDRLCLSFDTTESTIPLSEYIFVRLAQLGLKSVFGVPGDFNLNFLEHIYNVKQLNWVGCCNELNAAYAADGYSRTSGVLGALVTTYGVGELSAINGIGGSYAEYVPVLHIVGTSALKVKKRTDVWNIHHLMGASNQLEKPDHYVYEKMAKSVSVVQETLEDLATACQQVDNAIVQTYTQSRPGYLFLPLDLADSLVSTERLFQPLDLDTKTTDDAKVAQCASEILKKLYQSGNTSILCDYHIKSFRMDQEVKNLVKEIGDKVNWYSAYLGKGILNESMPRFVGTYAGKISSNPLINSQIESSDLVLHIGSFHNELNDGLGSNKINQTDLVELNSDYVLINGKIDPSLKLMTILPEILRQLDASRVPVSPNVIIPPIQDKLPKWTKNLPLSQKHLELFLGDFLCPDDVLIVETCAFAFAVADIKMNGNKFVGQSFWNSIGYALPATLGTSLALRDFDLPGKVVVVQGDGAAQMTVQEYASYIRYKITPTVLLLNNNGYTIERVIKGEDSSYNDIAPNWDWCRLFEVFGDIDHFCHVGKVHNVQELVKKASRDRTECQFLELFMDRLDAPYRLLKHFTSRLLEEE